MSSHTEFNGWNDTSELMVLLQLVSHSECVYTVHFTITYVVKATWRFPIRSKTHWMRDWNKPNQKHVVRFFYLVFMLGKGIHIVWGFLHWSSYIRQFVREPHQSKFKNQNDTTQLNSQPILHCDREKHFRNCNLKNFRLLWVCVHVNGSRLHK